MGNSAISGGDVVDRDQNRFAGDRFGDVARTGADGQQVRTCRGDDVHLTARVGQGYSVDSSSRQVGCDLAEHAAIEAGDAVDLTHRIGDLPGLHTQSP